MSNNPTIDFSKYLTPQPAPQIDFSKYLDSETVPTAPPVAPLPTVKMKESLAPQIVHAATESLPGLGGLAGGIAGTPADVVSGPVGTVAGGTLGVGAGVELKQLANRAIFGNSEPSTTSKAGLTELGTQMGTAAVTGAALEGAGALANRAAKTSQDWQDLNDAIGATSKSIRMGKGAESLADASTMPGRGLANVGFNVEELKGMTPIEQMKAISPHWKDAGQAVDQAIGQATDKGVAVDVGNSATKVLGNIKNPDLQNQMIDKFNNLAREVGIGNLREATPAEARQLRQALTAGARFSPMGDLSSLGGIRAQLYGAVTSDLHDAVPGLADLDQHYSDLRSAMDAVQRGSLKFASQSAPSAPSVLQKIGSTTGSALTKKALGGIAGGYGLYRGIRDIIDSGAGQ